MTDLEAFAQIIVNVNAGLRPAARAEPTGAVANWISGDRAVRLERIGLVLHVGASGPQFTRADGHEAHADDVTRVTRQILRHLNRES